jgi:hypothetical protein
VGRKYKVLVDDGTEVLTDGDVAALERFVRDGGVFVALHNTGMHSPGQAYAWPITRLTGLRVKQDAPIGGHAIRFSPTQTLWPGLRGRSIPGWGLVLDWLHADVSGKPVSLETVSGGTPAGDIEAVAEWEGGRGVAVARRRIGKGSVILLGSTFWRTARDDSGAYRGDDTTRPYLDELLTSLGVPRESWNTGGRDLAPKIWAEHWHSKNGLYDLYPVAFMFDKAGAPAATVDVCVRREQPTAGVWELSEAGRPWRAATVADGRLRLAGVTLAPMQARVFAAPRPDLESAPLAWLDVQKRQWGRLPELKETSPPPAASDPNILPMVDDWRLTAAAPADGWVDHSEASADWASVRLGSFASLGLPEEAVAHFFKTTRLPAAWAANRVRLVFDAPTWIWGLNPKGRIWLDGQPLPVHGNGGAYPARHFFTGDWDSSFSVDVTDRVRDGSLTMAIEIDGRQGPKERHYRPSGVTGVFYLQAKPAPVATSALAEWFAATDVNVLTPVKVGQKATFTYLETHFTLPPAWPGRRVFLEAPDDIGLHWLIVNNTVASVPGSMNRLDISNLVNRQGVNVVRWQPGGVLGAPTCGTRRTLNVPALALVWWP